MADTEGSRGEGDLPDVREEPEPGWVEGIRRGREERAERLKSLLGQAPPGDAAEGEPPSGEDQLAGAGGPEPLAGAGEPEPPGDAPERPA
jgi:hypothetical protein